jgi:hypothetical protein
VPETRRRLPRYPAFLVSGAAVGLVAALVLALGPGSGVADQPRLLAYLGALLGGIGALLGGLVAVLIEARRG